ncbi:MAG TPA: asparagine synthase-related protein [Candidatus Acidoferrales bacterium]|jgi:asparagine synthase (glutamine-hydrolysing)|nr:asparagine synthase-related protein [Candidatus Acidoferrales bacterium]
MSGIAGMIHLDGRPADRALIESMTASLAFRGPDGQHVWTGASVALGHTLLKTTFEAESERQPASLYGQGTDRLGMDRQAIDGQVWITADARIDAREDLARELELPQSALARPDYELILHAYALWGEACVDHLLGDFAFAIWDAPSRKLFCARDHFGIKPFFYAHHGGTLVFSNTLNCIRLHPAVSDRLNELAIGDFLLFDANQDTATTIFADIRRLPAAHVLVATVNGVSTRRYWSLPEDEPIRYRRTRDYVEGFRSLLETATADRLRTARVAVTMSGGLDSPAVAAFARKVSPGTALHAHTLVYDWLIPDEERHFAGLVAESLGMSIVFTPLDGDRPYARVENFGIPEPWNQPLLPDFHHRIAAKTPVILTGYGADPLLSVSPLMSWAAVQAIPPVHTALNFARYMWDFRTLPQFRLRSTLQHLLGRQSEPRVDLPGWLNADFVRRCRLDERAVTYRRTALTNQLRPLARRSLCAVTWPAAFEAEDAACLDAAVEHRHPFFDLRLVRYLMAIPELPFSMDKYLLRLALRGMVPEPVRTRPKTLLQGDPLRTAFKQHGLGLTQPIQPRARLNDFVNPNAIPVLTSTAAAEQLWVDLRVATLNCWLQYQEKPNAWKR